MVLFQKLFGRFQSPADDGTSGSGGGGADRGDTLSSGAPETPPAGEVENPLPDDDKGGEKEGDEDKDKDEDKKHPHIPLSRHKAILERERQRAEQLEAQLRQAQRGAAPELTNEAITKAEEKISSLETQYSKLLADGELEKATATMAEIRKLERSLNDQITNVRLQEAETRAVERARYDIAVERLEAAYPQLNPDHADFDKDAVAEVLELKEAYELKGYTPTQALQKAVTKQFPAATAKQEQATTVTPRVDKDEVAKQREREARQKAIDAKKRTPASSQQVGLDSDKLGGGVSVDSIMKMSQDDFAKLDEATLARMRGDDV